MSSNMYSDMTIGGALARRLQSKWSKLVRSLARATNYHPYELQAMCLIFYKLCEQHGLRNLPIDWWGSATSHKKMDYLDRQGFRDSMSALLEMQDSAKLEALFRVLDRENRRYITKSSWIKSLSGIRGTKVERSLMCWQAYDSNSEGKVFRNDMVMYARNMFEDVQVDDFDGFVKEFVDVILKDTKAVKDGYITLPEYLDIVNRRPLFREFLDQVLPSRDALCAFLSTFVPDRVVRKRRMPFVSQFYFL